MVLKSVQERRCEKRREEVRRVVAGRGERTTKQEFGRGVGGVRFCDGVCKGLRGVCEGWSGRRRESWSSGRVLRAAAARARQFYLDHCRLIFARRLRIRNRGDSFNAMRRDMAIVCVLGWIVNPLATLRLHFWLILITVLQTVSTFGVWTDHHQIYTSISQCEPKETKGKEKKRRSKRKEKRRKKFRMNHYHIANYIIIITYQITCGNILTEQDR